MKEPEYLRLKAQIEKNYHHELDALETVWRISNANGAKPGAATPRRRRRNGGLNTAITPLLPALAIEDTFNQPKVFEMLQNIRPELDVTPAAVSSALRRLEEDGVIQIVERGAGQRASTYQVKIKPLSLDDGEDATQSAVQ